MSAEQKNKIVYDKDFLKDVGKLPIGEQEKLAELLERMAEDAFHPLLHTKSLSAPLQGMFAFRITRGYRVGFKFLTPDTIQLLAADRRDKIYSRLKRKL